MGTPQSQSGHDARSVYKHMNAGPPNYKEEFYTLKKNRSQEQLTRIRKNSKLLTDLSFSNVIIY
jgi:hypothetical protein